MEEGSRSVGRSSSSKSSSSKCTSCEATKGSVHGRFSRSLPSLLASLRTPSPQCAFTSFPPPARLALLAAALPSTGVPMGEEENPSLADSGHGSQAAPWPSRSRDFESRRERKLTVSWDELLWARDGGEGEARGGKGSRSCAAPRKGASALVGGRRA